MKVDLASGYHQIAIDDKEVQKTALRIMDIMSCDDFIWVDGHTSSIQETYE